MGTTLGELLDRAGGMRNGIELIALAPGGASSNFLPDTALDLSIDFDVLLKAGSMLGSGAVLFVGAGQNLLDAAVICIVGVFFGIDNFSESTDATQSSSYSKDDK